MVLTVILLTGQNVFTLFRRTFAKYYQATTKCWQATTKFRQATTSYRRATTKFRRAFPNRPFIYNCNYALIPYNNMYVRYNICTETNLHKYLSYIFKIYKDVPDLYLFYTMESRITQN